jgi:hypothetical protein
MGAVVAGPASATTNAESGLQEICSFYGPNYDSAGDPSCLHALGNGNIVTATIQTSNQTEWDPDVSRVWNDETYYSYKQNGTDLCLQYDQKDGVIIEATCSNSVLSQFWWFSGSWGGDHQFGKFRNLYPEEEGDPSCLYYDAPTEHSVPTVASCQSAISDWFSAP